MSGKFTRSPTRTSSASRQPVGLGPVPAVVADRAVGVEDTVPAPEKQEAIREYGAAASPPVGLDRAEHGSIRSVEERKLVCTSGVGIGDRCEDTVTADARSCKHWPIGKTVCQMTRPVAGFSSRATAGYLVPCTVDVFPVMKRSLPFQLAVAMHSLVGSDAAAPGWSFQTGPAERSCCLSA